MKKIVAIIVLLAIVTVGIYWVFVKKSVTNQPRPPVVVKVGTAKQQQWYSQIKATGTISAFQGIIVRPEVAGRITHIYFDSGTYTEKDKPLFQIYPDVLQAQLLRYEAAFKLAVLDYERGKKLYNKGVVSRQDFDTLSSNLEQKRALVDETKAQLVQHNIRAPFDGQLGLRMVDAGEYVQLGQNLVSLQQLSPIRVQFSVPESYLPLLALQQEIEITPSANPAITEKGKVYAFDSAIDPNTRTIAMRASVPNKDHLLIPGGFVNVTLFAGKKHPVITVPQTAINYSTLGVSVYLATDKNTAKSIPITVGDRMGSDIEVKTGLRAGQKVIIAGQLKLFDGAKIAIAPSDSTASTPGENSIDSSHTDKNSKKKQD